MSTNTTHYALIKYEYADNGDLVILSGNFDIIDAELFKKANKPSRIAAGNLLEMDADGNPCDSGKKKSDFANITTAPQKTTTDITYYISPSGDDTTGDGTNAKPFKTIQHAINLIPQIVNHTVNINILDGTYNETIILSGYFGKGLINISGNLTNPTNCIVNNVIASQCSIRINLNGITAVTTNTHAFYAIGCNQIFVSKCISTSDGKSGGYAGFFGDSSLCSVNDSQFNNKSIGILSGENSTIYSNNNGGSGNSAGLQAYGGATIGKYSNQPSGNIAEATYSGGVIR